MSRFKLGVDRGFDMLGDRIGGGSAKFDTSIALGTATEGGYYIGVMSFDEAVYAIILSPKTAESSGSLSWGSAASMVTGATSHRDGKGNSDRVLSLGLAITPNFTYAAGLTTGGYLDWYVPSIEELRMGLASQPFLPGGQGFNTSTSTGSSTEANASNQLRHFHNAMFTTAPDVTAKSVGIVRPMRRVPVYGG